MAFEIRNLRKVQDLPYNTTGGAVQRWGYATPDAAATVLTAGYFNGAASRLKVNDIIEVVAVAGGVGVLVFAKVTAVPSGGNITVTSNTPALA